MEVLVNKEVKNNIELDGVSYDSCATFKKIYNKEIIDDLMYEAKFNGKNITMPLAYAYYRNEIVGYMMEELKGMPSINYLALTNESYDKDKVLSDLIDTLVNLEVNGYIYEFINASNILVDSNNNIKITNVDNISKNITIDSLINLRKSILDIAFKMYYNSSYREMIRSYKYYELDYNLVNYIHCLNNSIPSVAIEDIREYKKCFKEVK